MADLGRPGEIGVIFAGFQKCLYQLTSHGRDKTFHPRTGAGGRAQDAGWRVANPPQVGNQVGNLPHMLLLEELVEGAAGVVGVAGRWRTILGNGLRCGR